jgi:hypothetical protein
MLAYGRTGVYRKQEAQKLLDALRGKDAAAPCASGRPGMPVAIGCLRVSARQALEPRSDVMIPNKLPLNSASGSGDVGRSLRPVDQA